MIRPGTGTSEPPLLQASGVTIAFGEATRGAVVRDASFSVASGEILGLVGESGSGKTLLARSVMRLLPPGARLTAGSIRMEGRELTTLPAGEMRRVRGARIGMVFQEPLIALNPSMRIGDQLLEGLRLHSSLPDAEIEERGVRMLERVRMPDPRGCLRCYPHQFSGGMRQRVMLASAMLLRPAVLLADEPTTALDSIAQREVLEIMVEVARDTGTAVVLISHDLALVARYASRVLVMRAGEIVEGGSLADVLLSPRHPYTRSLLAALPRRCPRRGGGREEAGVVVEARQVSVSFQERRSWPFGPRRAVRAVDGVDLEVRRGESLAVVGESGSGKTTLGRAILGLRAAPGASIRFAGTELSGLDPRRLRPLRPRMQLVFQDPYSSLDPRMRVGQIVGEGMTPSTAPAVPSLAEAVRRALAEVGLSGEYEARYPHELSGGQRQRVCIARALIRRPELVVADEPVASLDVTTQAEVLAELARLQQRHGFALLLISHDLGVVEQVADRVAVMLRGRIVELGARDAVFDSPRHPYTCRLLAAAPVLVEAREDGYRVEWRQPRAVPPPPGWAWDAPDPEWSTHGPQRYFVEVEDGHFVACRPMDVAAPAARGARVSRAAGSPGGTVDERPFARRIDARQRG